MNIDEDTWIDRFLLGSVSLVALIFIVFFFGTAVGRNVIIIIVVSLSAILGLGWAVETLHEAYQQYVQ